MMSTRATTAIVFPGRRRRTRPLDCESRRAAKAQKPWTTAKAQVLFLAVSRFIAHCLARLARDLGCHARSMNLRTHFDEAARLFRESGDDSPLASTDPELLRQVSEGLRHTRTCEKLVSELSIFSSNETVDDINPSDLKYLLVPYLAGELTMRQVDEERRIDHLRVGRAYLEGFLESLGRVCLITDAEATELAGPGGRGTGLGGMAMSREQRIARIKAERAAQAKMEAIEAKLAAARKRGDGGKDGEERDDDMDELEREHATLWLHVAKFGAAASLQSIAQELPMLEEVARRRIEDPNFGREEPNPPPAEGAASSSGGQGLQSFHIPHPSRAQAYDTVRPATSIQDLLCARTARTPSFTPSPSSVVACCGAQVVNQVRTGRIPGMHTIELDDWQAGEAKRITQELLHQQEAAALKEAAEERKRGEPQDALQEAEELAERAKAMSMDDFKETHAKGSGNRYNRG